MQYVILNDDKGSEILPVTRSEGVFVDNGTKTLSIKLQELETLITNMLNYSPKVKTLNSSDFVSQTNGGYVATVTHEFNSKTIIVNVYDNEDKMVFAGVTLKDNSTIEIYNETAIDCTVVISGGFSNNV